MTIDPLSDLFAEDYERHVGENDHHAPQSHRVYRVEGYVYPMVVGGHYSDEGNCCHRGAEAE